MIKLKNLLNESTSQNITTLQKIVKKELGRRVPGASVHHFKDNMYVVSPGGFYRTSHIQFMADELSKVIPKEMLDTNSSNPISVGTGGATEGQIIIRLKK